MSVTRRPAPSCASAFAIARPMPLPAPVTIADSPANKTAFTAGVPVRFAPGCSCGQAGDNDTLFAQKLIQKWERGKRAPAAAAPSELLGSLGNDDRVSLPDQ